MLIIHFLDLTDDMKIQFEEGQAPSPLPLAAETDVTLLGYRAAYGYGNTSCAIGTIFETSFH